MKSYLVLLFIACFLFSMQGEAKLLTTKEVAAKKLEKKAAISKAKTTKSKKAVAAKAKKTKNKRQVASKVKKKEKKVPRKVVRLDFEKKEVLNNKVKPRKELKKIAKTEKAQKKSFKSIACADGFIVGQRAFCSTTPAAKPSKIDAERSLASEINMESKKLE
ncbi:hypothetical protein K2X05_13940 [bacterium]|nr:hypothetical protein [bacterium]